MLKVIAGKMASSEKIIGRYAIYTITALAVAASVYLPAHSFIKPNLSDSTLRLATPYNDAPDIDIAKPKSASLISLKTSQPTKKVNTAKIVASKPLSQEAIATLPLATVVPANATINTPQELEAIKNQGTLASLPIIEKNVATDEPAPAPSINWKTLTVKKNETLSEVFERADIGANVWFPLSRVKTAKKYWGRLKAGDNINVSLNNEGKLEHLRYPISVTKTLVVTNSEKGLVADIDVAETSFSVKTANGTITDSFYIDALKSGMEDGLIMQLAELFGWDIDFALDIRKGDTFAVVYEDQYHNNKRIGRGDILAAEFVNRGKVYRTVRYKNKKDKTFYFTPEGRSMKKAFLRSPLHFSHISSHFNPKRVHPIFKTIRPHRGVDYAARSGTKIKASGDGKVAFIGRQRGYGKVVILKHGEKYSSLYAHMRGFRKGLRKGSRVKQGDTIGYVGQTGAATGPHLHYEFRVAGRHKNPLTVKLPASSPIASRLKGDFKKQSASLLEQLDAVSTHTQFALRETNSQAN